MRIHKSIKRKKAIAILSFWFYFMQKSKEIVYAIDEGNHAEQLVKEVSNQNLLFFLIVTIAVLLVIFVILIINIKKRTKAERAAFQSQAKLDESYKELEAAYQEVTVTKNSLFLRYEELKKSKERIIKIAYSDYLTELPNRIAFTEMLNNVMLTLRNEEVIALMDIDLDNFKNINDTLGHPYGDEMLIDVTHRLKDALDENDYIARIGGDEFVILSQNIGDTASYEAKIKSIQKVFSYPFVLSAKEFFLTVSIGITLAPKDGKTTQTLIKNMDSAMYAAKEKGKNNYCYFDDSMNSRIMERIEMQSELRRAIEEDQFIVYYQAQMDLVTNCVVGFEALARWEHPIKGIIQPIDFIPLAEENGLIVVIGKKILRDACAQLKNWEDLGYKKIVMAVNLSARQFRDKDFIHMIYEVLEETGVDPHFLELEITEVVALDDLEFTVATISKLRELGIAFSLDDFGTGYSSLNYLKRLPINNLKIDKSLLDTILEDNSDQKIVSTIIELAQFLNISVIAEGVEEYDQDKFLKTANCNKAQGYFYSRPVAKDQAELLLKKAEDKHE